MANSANKSEKLATILIRRQQYIGDERWAEAEGVEGLAAIMAFEKRALTATARANQTQIHACRYPLQSKLNN